MNLKKYLSQEEWYEIQMKMIEEEELEKELTKLLKEHNTKVE